MTPRRSNCARRRRAMGASPPFRRDSGVEVFRHNPSDGSFAHLACQPSFELSDWNCGSSRADQSYCRGNTSSLG